MLAAISLIAIVGCSSQDSDMVEAKPEQTQGGNTLKDENVKGQFGSMPTMGSSDKPVGQ